MMICGIWRFSSAVSATTIAREAGDFIDFLVEGDAFLQVLELDGAGDFGEEREGVRIPLADDIALRDLGAFFHAELGAVNDGVPLLFAALVVDDGDGAVAVEGDEAAGLGTDGDEVDEADGTGVLGLEVRGVVHARCRAADVEGAHGELGAGLADGLGRDDADGFAHFDHFAGAQVAAVAEDADAALGLAGEDGADLDLSIPAAWMADARSSSISWLTSTMVLPSKSLSFSSETRPMMRSRSGSMVSPASIMGVT